MKLFAVLGFVGCISFFFNGCTRSHPVMNEQVLDLITTENWVIAHFAHQGKDETEQFKDYSFNFRHNGQLFVQKGAVNLEASWVLVETSNRFYINLGPDDVTNEPLGDLTNAWLVVASSKDKWQLKDADTGNEVLEFVPR